MRELFIAAAVLCPFKIYRCGAGCVGVSIFKLHAGQIRNCCAACVRPVVDYVIVVCSPLRKLFITAAVRCPFIIYRCSVGCVFVAVFKLHAGQIRNCCAACIGAVIDYVIVVRAALRELFIAAAVLCPFKIYRCGAGCVGVSIFKLHAGQIRNCCAACVRTVVDDVIVSCTALCELFITAAVSCPFKIYRCGVGCVGVAVFNFHI